MGPYRKAASSICTVVYNVVVQIIMSFLCNAVIGEILNAYRWTLFDNKTATEKYRKTCFWARSLDYCDFCVAQDGHCDRLWKQKFGIMDKLKPSYHHPKESTYNHSLMSLHNQSDWLCSVICTPISPSQSTNPVRPSAASKRQHRNRHRYDSKRDSSSSKTS